jgi:type I restriction enzyme M protein
MSISSLIWNSADDVLRLIFKPHEYGSVILPFVVLRRLDCTLEEQKDEIYQLHQQYKDKLDDPSAVIKDKIKKSYYNRSKYDLSRLKSDPQNIMVNFKNYINGYSENVFDIIENFDINKHVDKLNKHNRLYKLIDKFTEVDLHPDKVSNHEMGLIYEELLRKFSEQHNEESGDHFTPRDIVKLLVSLIFEGDKESLQGTGKIRSIYDPCCGTGGMLTIGKEWIHENINSNLKINLYGQELNDTTYAICKSDFLITGEDPENIRGPKSSISEDQFQGQKYDYMIVNPPYGVSWNSEKEFVENEKVDPNGRFFVDTPRVSDGSFLFLQHLIHKMEPSGSRIGIVFNGSPLFTGDAGQGESEIRKWIIENDWLESIIQLPDRMFFNTDITTYLWIVTNKKKKQRENKVQLIDSSKLYIKMKKNLGDKSKEISDQNRKEIVDTYLNFEENDICKIYNNNYFKYTKIQVERPLIENNDVKKDKKGNIKPNIKLRDHERVASSDNIDDFFEREVKPYVDDAWIDYSKNTIGYQINFTKYFYKFSPLRDIKEISKDLETLNEEIKNLSEEVINEE